MGYEIEIESRNKRAAAVEYRRKVVLKYEKWCRGEVDALFGEPAPSPAARVVAGTPRENAILTWAKVHQEPKYLRTLRLAPDAFDGLVVLDIGSGGIPSGLAFTGCKVLCLDPLMDLFRSLGYPFRHYEGRARFLQSRSEAMPFPDGRLDAMISVNALDHVDDFPATARETRRVLKNTGLVRFHVHYHAPTVLEPIALDDDAVWREFSWCPGMRKVCEWSASDLGADERHAVWSNFE